MAEFIGVWWGKEWCAGVWLGWERCVAVRLGRRRCLGVMGRRDPGTFLLPHPYTPLPSQSYHPTSPHPSFPITPPIPIRHSLTHALGEGGMCGEGSDVEVCDAVSQAGWYIYRACHLGHILRSDLSDTDDILRVQTDMCRRASCLLSSFYAANPAVKTLLFRSFCLSLHGSALWRVSSFSLRTLEVTFNNLLRRIWKLPRHCHTSILHCTSSLQSLFNVVICRSSMLCQKARATGIPLICDIFTGAPQFSYTTFGFNASDYNRYWRT